MNLEIPITVEFDDVWKMVDEIKSLQTYKLSEDDDMLLVDREDVADILARHVKAKNKQLDGLPSAQPERDIPIKPIEATDRAWGIPTRQAVCPKCDCYLGHVAFLGDYKGKRITYCETCGQAIDWEGWEFDE